MAARTLCNFSSALFMSWAFGLALVLGLALLLGVALALGLEALAGQTRRWALMLAFALAIFSAVRAAPRPLRAIFLAFVALPPPLWLAELLETPRLHQPPKAVSRICRACWALSWVNAHSALAFHFGLDSGSAPRKPGPPASPCCRVCSEHRRGTWRPGSCGWRWLCTA